MRRAACTLLLVVGTSMAAQKARSVQLPECNQTSSEARVILRTSLLSSPNGMVRMYGELESGDPADFAASRHCHVIYRLWVGRKGKTYRLALEKPWDIEDGETAGIALIGFSPNGARAAANFWSAQGDRTEDHLAVANLLTQRTAFRGVGETLSKQVSEKCDGSFVERLDAVTNTGDVLIRVPPSDVCPAAGTWSLNMFSGKLTAVSRHTKRKRRHRR